MQGRQLRLSVDLDVQEAGQEALAGGTGRGAFAVMDIKNGEVLGARLRPVVRPQHLLQGRSSPRDFEAPQRRGQRRADHQPRDPGRLSHRLHVQAHHGDGGAGGGPDHARHAAIRRRARFTRGRRRRSRTPAVSRTARWRCARRSPSRATSSSTSWAPSWTARATAWGSSAGPGGSASAVTRASTCRASCPASCPRRSGATPCTRRATPRSPGRRATTSTCPSARATCRPTRCRWRWPTRRSPTAAGCCARASASGSRTPRAARSSSSRRRPRGGSKIAPENRQAILDGLRGAASEPGGTSTAVFQDFPIQVAGKTGTAEKGAGRADQSWYVALAPWPEPASYVVAVTDEAGGFGADTAAPMARRILAALFGVKRGQAGRRAGARPTDGRRIARRATSASARIRVLPIDPLLLLATLGLAAAASTPSPRPLRTTSPAIPTTTSSARPATSGSASS